MKLDSATLDQGGHRRRAVDGGFAGDRRSQSASIAQVILAGILIPTTSASSPSSSPCRIC